MDRRKELEFDFENRPYHFIDMETGEDLKVHPNNIRDTYLDAIHNYHKELQLRCAQYHIDLVDADINQGFYQILQSYLIKRNKMS
jgi:hypothetical protein